MADRISLHTTVTAMVQECELNSDSFVVIPIIDFVPCNTTIPWRFFLGWTPFSAERRIEADVTSFTTMDVATQFMNKTKNASWKRSVHSINFARTNSADNEPDFCHFLDDIPTNQPDTVKQGAASHHMFHGLTMALHNDFKDVRQCDPASEISHVNTDASTCHVRIQITKRASMHVDYIEGGRGVDSFHFDNPRSVGVFASRAYVCREGDAHRLAFDAVAMLAAELDACGITSGIVEVILPVSRACVPVCKFRTNSFVHASEQDQHQLIKSAARDS